MHPQPSTKNGDLVRMTVRALTMGKVTLLAVIVAALMVTLVTMASSRTEAQDQAGSQQGPKVVKAGAGGQPGPLSAAQKTAINEGYLVTDKAAYERAKAKAAQKAEQRSGEERPSAPGTQAPVAFRTWEGVFDAGIGPSDSTG